MRIDRHRVWSLVGASACFRWLGLPCVAILCLGSLIPGVAEAQAIDLQLPTFNYFSVNTTVMVPDRGSAILGGVGSSSSSSNQFGPPFFPPTRSQSHSTGAGFMSVSVQIHDMEAMDQAVLAEAAARNGSRRGPGLSPAQELAGMHGAAVEPPDAGGPIASVADLAARKAAAQAAQVQERERFLAKGQEALAAGKTGLAKVYLQMAARRATGEQKTRILAQLQAIESKSPVAAAR